MEFLKAGLSQSNADGYQRLLFDGAAQFIRAKGFSSLLNGNDRLGMQPEGDRGETFDVPALADI